MCYTLFSDHQESRAITENRLSNEHVHQHECTTTVLGVCGLRRCDALRVPCAKLSRLEGSGQRVIRDTSSSSTTVTSVLTLTSSHQTQRTKPLISDSILVGVTDSVFDCSLDTGSGSAVDAGWSPQGQRTRYHTVTDSDATSDRRGDTQYHTSHVTKQGRRETPTS